MNRAPLISDLLDAIPDPAAVDQHWRRICRERVTAAAAAEYERGQVDGYLLAVADIKAGQRGAVRDAQLERRRWHVCCRRCRLNGHRDGCRDCEDRTRETFGQPHPDDHSPAEMIARARASWEPLGLPPAGMVHLAGPVVHHHRCEAVCYAHRPGWYTPEAAAAILETLPGDYAAVIAKLRAMASTPERGAA